MVACYYHYVVFHINILIYLYTITTTLLYTTCLFYTIFYLVNCRLDSRASILDLRVECQDLERFSVINRFAKFHSRGQHDGAETSSSSDTTFQRFFPVKLVTEVPLPRNLPDRVQCLSL